MYVSIIIGMYAPDMMQMMDGFRKLMAAGGMTQGADAFCRSCVMLSRKGNKIGSILGK